jgi:hypothetical protein
MIFSYGSMENITAEVPSGAGGGLAFVLRFNGRPARDVRIEGRNLMRFVAYLQQHRLFWCRETPMEEPFLGRAATVIERITVKDVEG